MTLIYLLSTSYSKLQEYLMNVTNQIERFADVTDLINYYVLLNSETRLQENFIYNLTENERLHTQLLKSLKVSKFITHKIRMH